MLVLRPAVVLATSGRSFSRAAVIVHTQRLRKGDRYFLANDDNHLQQRWRFGSDCVLSSAIVCTAHCIFRSLRLWNTQFQLASQFSTLPLKRFQLGAMLLGTFAYFHNLVRSCCQREVLFPPFFFARFNGRKQEVLETPAPHDPHNWPALSHLTAAVVAYSGLAAPLTRTAMHVCITGIAHSRCGWQPPTWHYRFGVPFCFLSLSGDGIQ